jgi:hypothetical protein
MRTELNSQNFHGFVIVSARPSPIGLPLCINRILNEPLTADRQYSRFYGSSICLILFTKAASALQLKKICKRNN